MLINCKFHHIGNVVKDIETARGVYTTAGYDVSPVIEETTQRAKVSYARKDGFPLMELLEPIDDKSHLNNILRRSGCGPYHICYSVRDINKAIDELKNKKYMPLSKPVPGHGLGDALTVFLYHSAIGLIQLVQL